MLFWLIIAVILLFLIKCTTTENFLQINNIDPPLQIQNECLWKKSCNYLSDTSDDIPLITEGCNNVPNYPKGLEPKINKIHSIGYPQKPFNTLVPKKGKYTFFIPELKYDGIYSRKLNNTNKCCWSNVSNTKETYGTNNFLHIPEKELYGKTVIEPPECQGYPTGYPPHYYIYDCKENNIPCSISNKIVHR